MRCVHTASVKVFPWQGGVRFKVCVGLIKWEFYQLGGLVDGKGKEIKTLQRVNEGEEAQ